jgi:flagellar export protein FliJ
MKKFTFTLDRVLEWRRAEARREEIKLERLHSELRGLDARRATVYSQRQQTEAELRARPNAAGSAITGEDLGALSAFQHFAAAELGRIAEAHARCQQQIEIQTRVLVGHRRDAKLFETLKQKRLTAWLQESEREISQQAEESHTAKWNRENVPKLLR